MMFECPALLVLQQNLFLHRYITCMTAHIPLSDNEQTSEAKQCLLNKRNDPICFRRFLEQMIYVCTTVTDDKNRPTHMKHALSVPLCHDWYTCN
jgi:hypothetical protein